MKVEWEETDITKGTRIWRDAECLICSDDFGRAAIIVLSTGRIMTYGERKDVAWYLTENGYRPTPK